MQVVAVPALLYDMTNSSTWLGVSSMAGLLPAVFLTPYAGVLSDRMSRRKILMITQTVQMLCAFILWTLYLAGSISPGLIVSIALVGGIATGFQTAAWQSFVQTMQKPGHPVHPDRAAFEKMTTPERLDQMQTMRQQRDAHMQKHAEATRVFYAQLTAEQKVIFDAQSMRHMSRMQGSMHASKHEHGHRH